MNQKGTNPASAEGKPTEAEKELNALREALAEERAKNNTFARNYILMSEELEAAQGTVNGYAALEALNIVNGNYRRMKALEAAEKHRREQAKKAMAAYKKACRRTVLELGMTAAIGVVSVLLAVEGLVHFTISTAVIGVCLLALGWLLHNCVSLLGGVKE